MLAFIYQSTLRHIAQDSNLIMSYDVHSKEGKMCGTCSTRGAHFFQSENLKGREQLATHTLIAYCLFNDAVSTETE
jgi:hypothetical protein